MGEGEKAVFLPAIARCSHICLQPFVICLFFCLFCNHDNHPCWSNRRREEVVCVDFLPFTLWGNREKQAIVHKTKASYFCLELLQ